MDKKEKTLYGACTGCGKILPSEEFRIPSDVEAYYRTFLLKIEKGEFPVKPENLGEPEALCPDCFKAKGCK